MFIILFCATMALDAKELVNAKIEGNASWSRPMFKCYYSDRPPVFDGKFHPEDWQRAVSVSLTFNSGADAGLEPHLKSIVKCQWDARNLYVLFLFEDLNITPASIKVRNNPWQDNNWEIAEIIINPKNSETEYFEISINHEGTMGCFLVKWQDGKPTWNAEWFETLPLSSVGKLLNSQDCITGWFAQLSIPWAMLGTVPPEKGVKWLINLHRADHDLTPPFLSWSPTLAGTFHVPIKFGRISFN